ncbi:methyltransferase domain-containing protein [candidate division WOR-3 bacterium]|nr:methyltransferase domain-containing protein [candidate division WOR-3 bacterium]
MIGCEWQLNLGCGEQILKGKWVNVDIRTLKGVDILCDIKCLPFKDSTFVKLWASDVLEHNPRLDIEGALKEWYRVLKKGGILTLKIPNLKTIASNYICGLIDCAEFSRLIYGNQEGNDIANFHKSGFDSFYIKKLLRKAGFKTEKIIEKPSYPAQNNMIIKAEKKK